MIYPAWYTSSDFGPDKLASLLLGDSTSPLLSIIPSGSSKLLVNESDIQAHLDLLSVFHRVHHTVQEGGVVVDPLTNLPIIGSAQTLFLARAQHRFDLWTEKILQRPGRNMDGDLLDDEIPPIDVLLLLHSYLLHPIYYREDSMRVYPCLKGVGPFPLKTVVTLIDRGIMELSPKTAQLELWESLTSTPFKPPLKTLSTETVDITCPRCLAPNNIPWINNEGTGAGQNFSSVCASCGLLVHSGALSVGKFLRDIVSPEFLPHTIFGPKGLEDSEAARAISQIIKKNLNISNATEGDRFEWNMANIKATLFARTDILALVGNHRMEHLLSAYDHPEPPSFNLKSAVMRQARFISTMHNIQGEKSFGAGKDALIFDAIIQYHQYFLRSSDIPGAVPSVNVDLAFHTHMLSAANFTNDCLYILGCVLDHDDSMSRNELGTDLSQTIEGWKSPNLCRDNKPLSACPHCGGQNGHTSNCPSVELEPNLLPTIAGWENSTLLCRKNSYECIHCGVQNGHSPDCPEAKGPSR